MEALNWVMQQMGSASPPERLRVGERKLDLHTARERRCVPVRLPQASGERRRRRSVPQAAGWMVAA